MQNEHWNASARMPRVVSCSCVRMPDGPYAPHLFDLSEVTGGSQFVAPACDAPSSVIQRLLDHERIGPLQCSMVDAVRRKSCGPKLDQAFPSPRMVSRSQPQARRQARLA